MARATLESSETGIHAGAGGRRWLGATVCTLLLATACTYQEIAPSNRPAAAGVRAAIPEPANWQELLPAQIAAVQAAVAPYRNFEAAKRNGWKPFGGEEPLMGRHYHNDDAPDYVFGDPLDFSRPNNLMYAEVDGVMVLTGVAFVVRIGKDEPVPPGFAGPEDSWHVHDMLSAVNAATEDRPFVRTLAKWWLDDAYFSKGDYRHRLAMVHVWTESPNPDGVFASYDRTLPYRKLGLPVQWSENVSLATARGVNLGSDNACKEMIDGMAWIGNFSRRQKRRLHAACEYGAERVRNAVGTTRDDLNRVAGIAWRDYESVFEGVVSPEQKERLAAMTEHEHAH